MQINKQNSMFKKRITRIKNINSTVSRDAINFDLITLSPYIRPPSHPLPYGLRRGNALAKKLECTRCSDVNFDVLS